MIDKLTKLSGSVVSYADEHHLDLVEFTDFVFGFAHAYIDLLRYVEEVSQDDNGNV